MVMARSSVALTLPRLPPSAMSASTMAPSGDGTTRIPKNGGDRRVRLANRNAHGADLGEFCQQRIGDGTAGGFDQAIVAPRENLRGGVDDGSVVNGVGKLVGA